MKIFISTILCCLAFQSSYSREGFWGVKFGTSLDSTGKVVFDKYKLTSYLRDGKLTYRDGTFGDEKFANVTLLFNQSDQLYKGVFIFRPKSYLDMVYDYRHLRWLLEIENGKPDVNVDEYPGGVDNKKAIEGSRDAQDSYDAHSIWYFPKGSNDRTSGITIQLEMDFKNDSPVITIEYLSNKLNEKAR